MEVLVSCDDYIYKHVAPNNLGLLVLIETVRQLSLSGRFGPHHEAC